MNKCFVESEVWVGFTCSGRTSSPCPSQPRWPLWRITVQCRPGDKLKNSHVCCSLICKGRCWQSQCIEAHPAALCFKSAVFAECLDWRLGQARSWVNVYSENEFFCETTPSLSALSVNQALDFQVSVCISVTKNTGSISMSCSREKRAVPLYIYETAGLYTFNSSDMTIKQLEQLPWQRRVWWRCDIRPSLWGGGEPQWTQGQGHTTCPHPPRSTQNDQYNNR